MEVHSECRIILIILLYERLNVIHIRFPLFDEIATVLHFYSKFLYLFKSCVSLPGVRKLMFVAAATASVESQDGEPLSVTNTTRMHISVALAKMVDSFG